MVDLLEDPLKDFMNETQILSKLRHPNTLRLFGASNLLL
jgi:hypothetical protein